MRLLLTSAGVKNTSINNALVDLLGKPIADSSALCIPTAMSCSDHRCLRRDREALQHETAREVPEPMGIYFHNRPVLKTFLAVSGKAQKWSACDENLKSFAHMAVAAQVGCSWCLDFGYFHAHNEGLDERKASQVPVGAPQRSSRRLSETSWSSPRR